MAVDKQAHVVALALGGAAGGAGGGGRRGSGQWQRRAL
jgi:hypothetical protein